MNIISKATPGVYCIENVSSGKKYIGQAQNIKTRTAQHRSQLEDGKHFNIEMQKDFNEGQDFKTYVIEELLESKTGELRKREALHICKFNTIKYGYNTMTPGTVLIEHLIHDGLLDGNDPDIKNINCRADIKTLYSNKFKDTFEIIGLRYVNAKAKLHKMEYLGVDYLTESRIPFMMFEMEYGRYCVKVYDITNTNL